MDKGPLVDEEIAAAARFLGEFTKSYPVQCAFWLKEGEHHNWKLYIVSEQITDENFDDAYGEVVRIAGAIQDPMFDIFQVKVIGTDDPLAKAALAMRQRYPSRTPIRFRDTIVGGAHVEDGYIYPSPLPVPAQ